jgi:hypothetical protein
VAGSCRSTKRVNAGQVCHVRGVNRKIVFYDLTPPHQHAGAWDALLISSACPTRLELVCKRWSSN